MPFKDTKTAEFGQYQKSDKVAFIIYADLKKLMEKINGCKSNKFIPQKIHSQKRR